MDFHQHAEHGAQVHRFGLGAAEFSVQAGGAGDVGDQAVEPPDVVFDDGHQRPLLLGVADPGHGFDGAAQGGERILDLVGDVGGKALDGVHPRPQRLGHFPERAREVADLVAAGGKIGNLALAAVLAVDPVGGQGQPTHRPVDGAGQIERQQHRHQQRHPEAVQDVHPH